MAQGTYQTRNFKAVHNPLRSLPFSRPAADVLHVPQAATAAVEQNVSPWPAPSADVLLQREFAAAEASLAIAVEALASARLVVVDAKRTTTAPIVVNGRPQAADVLSRWSGSKNASCMRAA